MARQREIAPIRSSAAEYLTFVAASGKGDVEAVYADESVWLSQKIMAQFGDVNVRTINNHLETVFADSEFEAESVTPAFRITADGRSCNTQRFTDRSVLHDAVHITSEIAKTRAEKEFEKWRIIQVRLFESGFDWRAEAVKILAASRMPSSPRGVTSTADMAAWKAGQKG